MNDGILSMCVSEVKYSARRHSTYCVQDSGKIVLIFEAGKCKWVLARADEADEMDIHPIALAATFQSGIMAGTAMTTSAMFEACAVYLRGVNHD